MKRTAKDEIIEFIESGEVGIKSEFTKGTLLRAAEDLFTAKGKPCPIRFFQQNGSTFLINRKELDATSKLPSNKPN